MNEEQEIEKSIEDQIHDKTMEKLKQSELFPETLIDELNKIDLTSKGGVKAMLTIYEEEK